MFGILEKVEEVGVENLLGSSPAMSSREPSIDRLYHGEDDIDELEEIRPGSLTITNRQGVGVSREPTSFWPGIIGSPSDCSMQLEGVDCMYSSTVGGRGPGRTLGVDPGLQQHSRRRPQLMGALGVPGTPGTGALKRPSGLLSVRPDLGSVPQQAASPVDVEQQSQHPSGFIGSIASMFFGRKGGLL